VALQRDAVLDVPGRAQALASLGLQRLEDLVDVLDRIAVGPEDRPREVADVVGAQQAGRREDRRLGGDHGAGDAHLVADVCGEDRQGAAKCEQREVARVTAPLDGRAAHPAAHVGDDEAVDGAGRLLHRHAERVGDDALNRRPRLLAVEPPAAAEERVRVHDPERHGGVGHRRLVTAAPVAGGARVCARAARPDLRDPARVEPRDAAAAGAHRDDVDLAQAGEELAQLHALGDGVAIL
jgi:hypothetical protein